MRLSAILRGLLAPGLLIGSTLLATGGIIISAKEASAWTATADFESGTVGQPASGANAFGWAGAHTTFSNIRAHTGSKSARIAWAQGAVNSTRSGSVSFPTRLAEGGEIWVRAYYYFQSPWTWERFDTSQARYIKFIRFNHRRADGSLIAWLSAMQQSTPGSYGEPWAGLEWATFQNGVPINRNLFQNKAKVRVPEGQWHAFEIYMKAHQTQGIVRLWVHGQLVLEYTGLNTLAEPGSYYDGGVLFMSYWNGGAAQNQDMYVDDIAITTDTPSGRDAAGNPLIGLQPVTGDTTAPQPPKGLRIN